MTLSSESICDPSPIFQDGKLKPGVYKIQNLYTDTYLDVHLHSMELCCRPAKDLENKRGFWKIGRLGDGYSVWRVDPGNHYQFCSPLKGLGDGDPVSVTPYPVGWRIERANDEIYRRFEYARFHFGSTDRTWDLWGGCRDNGARVKFCNPNSNAWQVWKFVPAVVEGLDKSCEGFGSGLLPPYDGNESGQSPAHSQHVGSELDDFGTVVTEVTTSIITTRKKYRVDA